MSNVVPTHEPVDASGVRFVVHPPERGFRRSSVPAQVGACCCCCCCCCLHSLGGLIGAAVAPNMGGGPKPPSDLSQTSYWNEGNFDLTSWADSTRNRQAVTAKAPAQPGTPPESIRPSQAARAIPEYGPSAVRIFWWTLLVLAMGGVLLPVLFNQRNGLIIGLIIVVLVLPGLQMGAAILTALIMAMSARPDKSYQFGQLGKIVFGVVVGTLIGILVMVVLFFGLSR